MTSEVKDILLVLFSLSEVIPEVYDSGSQGHPLSLFSLLEVIPEGCDW